MARRSQVGRTRTAANKNIRRVCPDLLTDAYLAMELSCQRQQPSATVSLRQQPSAGAATAQRGGPPGQLCRPVTDVSPLTDVTDVTGR